MPQWEHEPLDRVYAVGDLAGHQEVTTSTGTRLLDTPLLVAGTLGCEIWYCLGMNARATSANFTAPECWSTDTLTEFGTDT